MNFYIILIHHCILLTVGGGHFQLTTMCSQLVPCLQFHKINFTQKSAFTFVDALLVGCMRLPANHSW